MKSVDLICHWVREHEWGKRAWCCAIEESHTCSVLHGGDPVHSIMHWPFVHIPTKWRNSKNGAGIGIKLRLIPFYDSGPLRRAQEARVHLYISNMPSDAYRVKHYASCKLGLEDPGFWMSWSLRLWRL